MTYNQLDGQKIEVSQGEQPKLRKIETTGGSQKSKCAEVINIGDEFKDHLHRPIEKLSKFQDISTWYLGIIQSTNNQIRLSEEAKSSFERPYRGGPTQGEHEKKEIKRMIEAGVINQLTSEWAAPVVFTPKNVELYHFVSINEA